MKSISAIAVLAAAVLSAAAQTNQVARPMSLQDCFAEALKHNLAVQISRYDPQTSLYNLYASYGGYDPTFSLGGTHSFNATAGSINAQQQVLPGNTSKSDSFDSGIQGVLPSGLTYDFSGNVAQRKFYSGTNFLENSSGNIGVTLNQPLLKNFWIDNTRLSISVAKNRLKYSEQGLRNTVITTVSSVETAYFELIYAKENVKVQQEAVDLANQQLHDDKQRVEVGSLAPLDVQQDEAQVAQDQANLIAAQFSLVTAQNTLKSLITDDYAAWHDTDVDPTTPMAAVKQMFDLQDSWNKGLTQRPDLIQAKLNVEQQGIQLKYSFNQLFPQLDLTGSYGFNGSGTVYHDVFAQVDQGNQPFYSVGAQLSMPLANVSARESYKSGKLTEQQLMLTLKQLEQTIMVSIDNAVKQAESAWESVQATHEARTYAESALDAEEKKYAVGKSTTFTVLQLQNNLTSARSQEIRSLANYNEALSNLAQQEGNTLERYQIDFKAN